MKKNNKKTSFLKIFLSLIFISLISLSVTQVIFANKSAAFGEKLNQLNEESNKLIEENNKLENQISKITAISYLQDKAEKNGFVKIASFVFLSSPIPIAYNIQ